MPQQHNQLLILINRSSVENNASWWEGSDSHIRGNEPSFADYAEVFDNYNRTLYRFVDLILDAVFAVIGTLINGWFLAAMLTSPEIRSRMRNKLLCAVLTVNLTVSAITLPLYPIQDIMLQNRILYLYFICIAHIALGHMQDFIGNWHIFILVCSYTSQVVKFKPRFTPLWMKIFTVVFIMSPSVVGFLFVTVILNGYFYRTDPSCSEIILMGLEIYASLNTIVPLSLASLLFVVAAVLKYRRYPYGRPCDTRCDQVIDDRFHIDPLYPYVALLVGVMVTDLCRAIILMNFIFVLRLGSSIWFYLLLESRCLRYLRLILVPVMLLLFADIRKRIKSWKPCRRSAPTPVDLVVTYEKNAV